MELAAAEDDELVGACLVASSAALAFETLYRRHAPCVRAFLRGFRGGDPHDVADAVQETFLRAYRALPRFDRSRPLRPWLLTIAARVTIDAQARGRRVALVEGDALADLAVAWPDARADVRDACDRLLREASARVSPRKLEAFLLSRAHGLSHREVAARLGTSVATVKRDLDEAAAILAGLAQELGLLPEPVVAVAEREEAAAPAGWTPPADGVLSAALLERMLGAWRELADFVRRTERLVAEARDGRPVDPARLLGAVEAMPGRDGGDVAAATEEVGWALGVAARTARALCAGDAAARAVLVELADDGVAGLEARLADVAARRARAGDADRAAEASELDARLALARQFMAVAEAELAKGAGDMDPAEQAMGEEEMARTRAMFAEMLGRAEALRGAGGAAEADAAWRARLDEEEARLRRRLDELRRMAAAARALEGADLAAGLPPANLALVRPRLLEVIRALGPDQLLGEPA